MYKKFFPNEFDYTFSDNRVYERLGYIPEWARELKGKKVTVETDRIGHIGKCSIVPEWCDRTKKGVSNGTRKEL